MKRYFIPFLFPIGFPLSVSATNYVECEAIRAVIMRNEIQMEKAEKNAVVAFEYQKVEEKYADQGIKSCYDFGYDTVQRKECNDYEKSVITIFKDEALKFFNERVGPYEEIEERATKDFKKRGCYWF